MTDTPLLGLPLLAAAQSQKHITHNEALSLLDALVHLAVLEKNRSTPPTTPAVGDRYLLGASPTGAFAGQGGKLAFYDVAGWHFASPKTGWRVYVTSDNQLLIFDGTLWKDVGSSLKELQNLDFLGVGTTADTTNRLSVRANAALLTAKPVSESGSGDIRLTLNKEASSNTVSQLFQTAFSGRAEWGLTGDDDFRLKVSADGSTWREALRVERATGIVSFPQGVHGLSPERNLLINGDLGINQRAFAGGSLSAGTYGFDRWKAGAGGCTLSRATDGTLTLNGALEQVVEAPRLASKTVTLSVENPSGDIPVVVGSQSGTITAGTGRRGVTLTLLSGDSGDITVRLNPSSSRTFSRIKLEVGSAASAWHEPDLCDELMRCQRYFESLIPLGVAGWLNAQGLRLGTNAIDIPLRALVAKRTSPTLLTSVSTFASGAQASGNQISFFNYASNGWETISGALTLSLLSSSAHSQGAILRLQAATSFSGSTGQSGLLFLGASAWLALSAEL
jgi:hypothetical protein